MELSGKSENLDRQDFAWRIGSRSPAEIRFLTTCPLPDGVDNWGAVWWFSNRVNHCRLALRRTAVHAFYRLPYSDSLGFKRVFYVSANVLGRLVNVFA